MRALGPRRGIVATLVLVRLAPDVIIWKAAPSAQPQQGLLLGSGQYSHYSVLSVPVISTVNITGTTQAAQSPRDQGM